MVIKLGSRKIASYMSGRRHSGLLAARFYSRLGVIKVFYPINKPTSWVNLDRRTLKVMKIVFTSTAAFDFIIAELQNTTHFKPSV